MNKNAIFTGAMIDSLESLLVDFHLSTGKHDTSKDDNIHKSKALLIIDYLDKQI